jgi:hypothetical protein
MLSPRVLLLLLLLVSSVGLAQTQPPLVPAPEPAEQPPPAAKQPPPAGESIPYEYEPELQSDPIATRIMLELLGGTVGGAGGIVVGGFVVGLLYAATGGCNDATPVCGIAALVILGPAISIGVALGVSSFGRYLDGEGEFTSTLIGFGVGVGVALLASVVTTSETVLTVGIVAGPIIGAVIGYEISHAQAMRARKKAPEKKRKTGDEYAALTGPGWSPMVGTTPHGGFFGGLSGRF